MTANRLNLSKSRLLPEKRPRTRAGMSGVKKQKKEVKEVLVGSYTPKNIMVTGGAGFIASHVVIQLVKQLPVPRIQGRVLRQARLLQQSKKPERG